MACWSTKAEISLKRVKINEKLLWRAYTKSQTLFRTVPSPTPYGLIFPRLGVRNPNPKMQSLLSQERVKLYRLQIWQEHSQCPSEQNTVKNLGEKGEWAYPGTAHIFEYLLLSQEWAKLRTLTKFVSTFIGTKEQKPIKIAAKVAVGVLRDFRKGYPYIGRIAW